MPQYVTLLGRDLATVFRSWLVRGWVVVAAFFAFAVLSGQRQEGVPASVLAANIQQVFLFLWSIFVIVISGGSVASEAGVLADSILSRPVTRAQYILAKLTGRSICVLAVFLLIAVPSTYVAWRYALECDISFVDGLLGTTCVALAMLFLTALGVALSSILRSSLIAIVVLALGWYAIGGIFEFLDVPYLSPFELAENLPAMLRGEAEAGLEWKIPIGFLIPTVAIWLATVAHFNYKDV